jgi:DnaK suppressor protein
LEVYMRQEQTEEIRKELMHRREDMLMDLRQKNAEAASLIDAGVPDPGDMGLIDYLTDFLHLLGDSRREEIMKIDDALLRLKEGTYGICQRCDEPIPMERLKVQPYTPHCVECQETVERENALRSGRPQEGKL